MSLSRRQFLRAGVGAGTVAAATSIVGCSPAPAGPAANRSFPNGVASGDPLTHSVLLWSRVAPDESGAALVRWAAATDPDFANVVATGAVSTDATRDWTVRAEATGLLPATTYYYRWSTDDDESPIGRTRTAPSGGVDHLRFAVVSCSNLGYGYFHHYRSVAERSDLDAVIHLGDYIYEYATEGFGETYGTARELDPPHEIVTLSDYRRRYACYRSDPDLLELHRQHPMIHVWDDHEFADDPFVGGAANHQPAADGPWDARVAAALQAYSEWMPTRLDGNRIFRTLDYGDLVRLVMVDRQRRFLWPAPDDGDAYLGREQFDWLDGQLASSAARWLVLVQQSTFGATDHDQASGGWGVDQRSRVFEALESSSTDNLIVLTGDIHRAHAIDLIETPGGYSAATGQGSAGVEFSCGSVTSPGGDSTDGGPQVRWTMGSSRTYLVLDITAERAQGDVFGFPDLLKYLPFRPDEQHVAAFATADGARHLTQVYTPAPPADRPGPAPVSARSHR